jgi:hypothetical protein
MGVEPDGLPAREVTAGDGGSLRPAPAEPAEPVPSGEVEEPTDIRSAANGRSGNPRPIRAATES